MEGWRAEAAGTCCWEPLQGLGKLASCRPASASPCLLRPACLPTWQHTKPCCCHCGPPPQAEGLEAAVEVEARERKRLMAANFSLEREVRCCIRVQCSVV